MYFSPRRWLGNVPQIESIKRKEEKESTDFPWDSFSQNHWYVSSGWKHDGFLSSCGLVSWFWKCSLVFSHKKTTRGSPSDFHLRLWFYLNQKWKLGMQNWSLEKSGRDFQHSLMPFVPWQHPPSTQNCTHQRTNYSSFKETAIKKFLAHWTFAVYAQFEKQYILILFSIKIMVFWLSASWPSSHKEFGLLSLDLPLQGWKRETGKISQ